MTAATLIAIDEQTVVIESRFAGPPGIGNGGITAATVAAGLPGDVRVRLKWPTPLDIPLTLARTGEGQTLSVGRQILATAVPAALDLDAPAPVSLFAARTASLHTNWTRDTHPFPNCFVCGPNRAEGDGMRLFPGPVAGEPGLYATPWQPLPELAGDDGHVIADYIWAALDCPGGIAAVGERPRPILLARMTASRRRAIYACEPYVVVGWRIRQDGRKHWVGTAIYDAAGAVCALAEALWIEPRG